MSKNTQTCLKTWVESKAIHFLVYNLISIKNLALDYNKTHFRGDGPPLQKYQN